MGQAAYGRLTPQVTGIDWRRMVLLAIAGQGIPWEMIGGSAYLLTDQMDQTLTQHQLRPVLQRLSQMDRPDLFTPRQIGDRARQLEDAMVRPR